MTRVNQISLVKKKPRQQWGYWRLHIGNWTLSHVCAPHYQIDLEGINTSAAMLDWIFQLSGKTWITPEDTTDLIEAFRDIFDPQANLCSFRMHKEIDARSYLRERYSR